MKLIQTPGPHIRHANNTQRTMLYVILSLVPCVAAGIIFYGLAAAVNIFASVLSAVIAEALWQKLTHKKPTTGDLSAVVTGLLIALCITPAAPWWIFVIGSFFAIIVVKQFFGGIGCNFVNPALAARALLLASWPVFLTKSIGLDAMSAATPLRTNAASFADLFLGRVPGAIGETCKIAILIGFVFLLVTGTIQWQIPVVTVASAALMGWILGMNPLTVVLSGGLLFGAVFMATDYVTSPMKFWAQIIYAFGVGVITVLIRKFGVFPEGVTYAILIMNLVSPLLDKLVPEKVYGYAN